MVEIEEDEAPTGLPAWLATFADLMSLLMCFFVLLLSFSEMDVIKYKQVAGSMKNAFGVQNKVKVKDIPKGTSIIAQEFSPGKTAPTVIKSLNQVTVETTRQSLRVGNPTAPLQNIEDLDSEKTKKLLKEKLKALIADTKNDANKLKSLLKKEIAAGKVDIETENRTITIRIREKGSFPSASATLHPGFIPVIKKLRYALRTVPGAIAVEGHTDNIPITSINFQSNWDLSSSRALSVTHELIKENVLDATRLMVIAHADTRPYEPNSSPENRAENRRVELVIRQGLNDDTASTIMDIEDKNANLVSALDTNDENRPNSLGG